MCWLDILILIPLVIGLIRGLFKGFIVQLISIVAIIIGHLGARIFGGHITCWLLKQFEWPEAVCSVISYIVLFIAISLTLNIIAMLITKLAKKISLGWLNRLIGGIFGIITYALITMTIVLCLHRLDQQFHFLKEEVKSESILYTYTAEYSEKFWNKTKDKVAKIQSEVSDNKINMKK